MAIETGKIHPEEKDNHQIISLSDKIREKVSELVEDVNATIETRRQNLDRNWANLYMRRYQLEFRGTTFPWPGASDIVMPLIDMKIDQMKPAYAMLIDKINMKPMNSQALKNARNADLTYDWLLNHRMDGYKKSMLYVIDDMLMYGWGIAKITHNYELVKVKKTVTAQDLPERILRYRERFLLVKNETEQKQIIRELKEMPPQMALGQPMPVTMSQLRSALKADAELEFGLSRDEKEDEAALNSLTDLLMGKTRVAEITFLEEKHNEPVVSCIPPYDFIVPWQTLGLQSADWCVHRMYYSKNSLKATTLERDWSKKALQNIVEFGGQNRSFENEVEQSQNEREGMGAFMTDKKKRIDNIEIWEVYTNLYEESGRKIKVVMTLHPYTKEILKIRHLPFDHGKWPFVQFPFEANSIRFHSSRGIPEKLKDIDREMTAQHRAKINRMTIANAPTFKYRLGSKINPNSIHWTPGEFIPVLNMQDLEPVVIPNIDISFEREENILRIWADQYIGTMDAAASSALNFREPRSATEVAAIEGSVRSSMSVRGDIFMDSLKELHGMIWDVWINLGPRKFEAIVGSYAPRKYTRQEIQGDFDIVPVGKIGEYNSEAEAQKALNRLMIMLKIPPQMLGMQYEVNYGEAFIDWLEKDGLKSARAFIRERSPQEIQQMIQQTKMQAAGAAQRSDDAAQAEGIKEGLQMGLKTGGSGGGSSQGGGE